VIISVVLVILSYNQFSSIQTWATDNFDTGDPLCVVLWPTDVQCAARGQHPSQAGPLLLQQPGLHHGVRNQSEHRVRFQDRPSSLTTPMHLATAAHLIFLVWPAGNQLSHYTCTNGACTRNTDVPTLKYCLPTAVCAKKAASQGQSALAAIGAMACWYLIYIVVCLCASSNVRSKMLEEQRQEDEALERGEASAVVSGPGVNTEMV
jgi:hypothetical protein